MSQQERGPLTEAWQHLKEARQESRAMLKSLLPEAFWEHAHASRREARAACQAFRRAVKRQLGHRPARPQPGKQEIEIA